MRCTPSQRSYWAEGIPRETVARAIANSIPFSVFHGGQQVGLARVITDRATFAYLSDVYILEPYRGRALSSWLMDTIMAHPDLQGLRRFSLTTRDADGLYRRYGSPTSRPAHASRDQSPRHVRRRTNNRQRQGAMSHTGPIIDPGAPRQGAGARSMQVARAGVSFGSALAITISWSEHHPSVGDRAGLSVLAVRRVLRAHPLTVGCRAPFCLADTES